MSRHKGNEGLVARLRIEYNEVTAQLDALRADEAALQRRVGSERSRRKLSVF